MTTVTTAKTINSREVAEMVEKQHKNLVRDIGIYIEILASSNLSPLDFFIESTYIDTQGKKRRCYEVTQKGCEMIAHKLTGQKGVIFTAKYINRFHEMQEEQTKSLSPEDFAIQQAEALLVYAKTLKDIRATQDSQQQQINQQRESIDAIKEAYAPMDDVWRKSVKNTVNKIATNSSLAQQEIWNLLYYAVEYRGKCNLQTRMENLRKRLVKSGATKTTINKVNRLDCIESDPKLKEVFTLVLREMITYYAA